VLGGARKACAFHDGREGLQLGKVGAAHPAFVAGAGAKVAATARHVSAHARDGVRFVAADLSTAEGARAVADRVVQELGGIDILVNVLGGSSAPVADSPRSATPSGRWN